MGQIRIISLQSDGTRSQEWAEVGDKYVIGKSTGHLRIVNRHHVFVRNTPVPFDTLNELLAAPAPSESFTRTQEKQMLVGFGDPTAIAFEDTPPATIRRETEVLYQVTSLQAAYEQKEAVEKQERLTRSYLIISITVAALCGIVVSVGLARMFL